MLSDDPNLYLRSACRCAVCTKLWTADDPFPEGSFFDVEQVLHYPKGQRTIFQALPLDCADAYWKPGWYFWDETQTAALGCFQNYGQAALALKQYAQWLDDGATAPKTVK